MKRTILLLIILCYGFTVALSQSQNSLYGTFYDDNALKNPTTIRFHISYYDKDNQRYKHTGSINLNDGRYENQMLLNFSYNYNGRYVTITNDDSFLILNKIKPLVSYTIRFTVTEFHNRKELKYEKGEASDNIFLSYFRNTVFVYDEGSYNF
ncbi:hypothetical protein [Dysgonomonas sp. HGC4]|uniref:hypothetical protein n=2 Tax=Dysgonomonas sp. HGC4 TaxID=1658009 RepID=UPI001783C942|nr:hypothetical protein [Dysgonomonas sp. HGC4]MBD8349286.1 hypothetical protein [Dysgonomonas sp. HGC4]